MFFKTLKFKNIKSYGDYETEVNLDFEGTALLHGKVGAGKTTFFDALLWGLYGECLVPVDELVNRTTKKNTKVEVVFLIGKQEYSVIRYRNHDVHANRILFYRGVDDISMKNAPDTQRLINEIVQIPYKVMVSTVVFSSELYVSFLRSRASDRLKIIESIFSLREVNIYYDYFKKEWAKLDKKVSELEIIMREKESVVETRLRSIDEYKENSRAALGRLKEERNKLLEKIASLEEKSKNYLSIDFDYQLTRINEYNAVLEHNKKTQQLIVVEKKRVSPVDSIKKKLMELKENYLKLKKIDVATELEIITSNKTKNQARAEIQKEIKLLQAQKRDFTALTRNEKSIASKIMTLVGEINILSTQESHVCTLCGQKTDEETHALIIGKKRDELFSLTAEQHEITKNKDKSIEENKNIDNQVADLGKKLEELGDNFIESSYTEEFLRGLASEIKSLERELVSLKKEYDEKTAINSAVSIAVSSLMSQIKPVEDCSEYSLEEITEMRSNSGKIKELIDAAKNRIATILESAKAVYDAEYVKGLENTIGVLNEELGIFKDGYWEKKVELMHYSFLLKILGNKDEGFKKFIIEKMIGRFNTEINFYLQFFFDDVKITFDKDLVETIDKNGQCISFDTFSSGQKTEADLAVAFALYSVVRVFFNSSVNFMVLDEILDRNLDVAGVNGVIEILKYLSSFVGIMVVSHREEYKDRFTNSILIKQDEDGFSQVII